MSLATAGPASATGTGTWRAYGNTNPITSSSSTWRCDDTVPVVANVYAQVCAIRSYDNRSVQGAVIVRNNRSSLYSAAAWVDLAIGFTVIGDWACSLSGVGAHSWSVCFGRTQTVTSQVNSTGRVNGVHLGLSPSV